MGWIVPAVSAAYGIYSSVKAKDAAKKAANQAGQVTPVSLEDAQKAAADQAAQNAAASNKLEQQYNPYINALRQQAAGGLNQYLTPSATSNALTSGYMDAFNQAGQAAPASNLFTNAADVAQQQLALGGRLDTETANQVMRAGAAHAGGMAGPGGGLGLGRDISARDLGLTSLQLQNTRMQNAANIGSTQQNYGLAQAQQRLSQLLGSGSAASGLEQQQYGRNLGLAGFTQGITQPESGLSPSSAAGIVVGNTNTLNSANQNAAAIAAQGASSQGALGGGLMGFGLNGLANTDWSKLFAPTTASQTTIPAMIAKPTTTSSYTLPFSYPTYGGKP
jgi:hypothetical protein